MSKKTKVKKSIRLTSMAVLVTGLVISPIKSNSPTAQVNKTPSPQTQDLQASTSTISLINGSFESPVVSSKRTYDIFAATSVPGWKTTDSSGKIEIQKNGFVSGTQTMYAQSGRQWAELNAYENAALYQDIPTTPGTKIHWQVYHKGRKGTDVALVEFGTPGATLVEQTEMSDSDTEWGLYKGTYIIPEGQTTTRFQFRAISSSDGSISSGNYLDDVQFAPASNLAVTGTFSESSIQAKNQVNYQIQATNNGGMVAATNHFSVQIPEELTYTPGTLSSSDTSITGENYDPATRTLTFETGSIGAANSINITLPLTGEVVTPAATPDTTVNYSDKNFEDEISTAEAADSSVEITSNEAPTITGEANTTLQPGDTFDPLNTITATDKEDGDITSSVKVTSNPVDTSKPGTYEVIYEVTDSDNNTASFRRTVVVTEAPVISGDSETRLTPNDTFDPMSTIQATDKEDGDITSNVKITKNTVDTSKPGTYEVMYEVTDSDGNKANFTRTVVMTEAPTITGDSETKINPNSTFDPLSTMQAADKEDGDITSDIQVVDNPVDTSKPGSYQVAYEVTDSDGNKANFTRTVIVTQAPVISGDSETILNPNATFDPMNTMIATDKEDGDITGDIQVVDNPVDASKPGSYEVAYEVTDSDGNKSTFTRTITVTEPPRISGESETYLSPNATFDPMNTMTATDKEDGNITSSINITNNTVDTSKPGNYEVTYEVTDSDGNKASFTRTVVVTEAPIITGDSETQLNLNADFDPMSTIQATDKEDGDITNAVKVTNNTVDTSKPGSYFVTYEVIDSDGNISDTFIRTVIVTEAPTISGDSETRLNPNADFDPMSTIQATDKEDGDITSAVKVTNNSVDTSKSGSYEVTYEVTDSDGNKAVFTRTVIVTEAPIISGDSETRLNPNADFDPMSTIQATDKEDGDITSNVKVTDNPVDTLTPGSYEVTYEVTDSDGNKAMFTRTVIVTEAPTITGESETILNPNAMFDPMSTMKATDKEDGDITQNIQVTNNTVDTSKPGGYLVTYEVTDSDGNISSTFIRTVIVTEAPIINGDSETHIKPEDHFDPMEGITATDKENGDLTEQIKIISNNVDVNVPGNYQVVYEVTDSDGNVTTFTSTVVVDLINQPSERSKDTTNPPKDMQSGKNEVGKKIIETKSDAKTEEKVSLPKTGDQSNTPTGLAGLGLFVVGLFAFFRIKK